MIDVVSREDMRGERHYGSLSSLENFVLYVVATVQHPFPRSILGMQTQSVAYYGSSGGP